ncbi:MAG TPA: hypothetical protein DHW22_04525 [Planctomycetaceae bacterium]|nr:hypothetical protein [Planctomycetaceae bacterium]
MEPGTRTIYKNPGTNKIRFESQIPAVPGKKQAYSMLKNAIENLAAARWTSVDSVKEGKKSWTDDCQGVGSIDKSN